MGVFDIFAPRTKPSPEVYDFPPMCPVLRYEQDVKSKMHEMLLVCLNGGMSYDDAKSACYLEFGDRLEKAKKLDESMFNDFTKRLKEFYARKEKENGGE